MKIKNNFLVLLSICLLVSLFSACGNGSENRFESRNTTALSDSGNLSDENKEVSDSGLAGDLILPLCEEKQELTVWLVYTGKEISDLNDIRGIQEMEKLTNVHINWIPVGIQEIQEKFNLLVGSGSYPDIIYPASYPYPGGIEKGIEDGVFINADELIREHMPNYMKCLEANEEARKEATSDDGQLLAPRIIVCTDTEIVGEGTYQGLIFRKDILDEMGLDMPETIDEWHDVLLKCKENGMGKPLMINKNGSSELSLAWGVNTIAPTNYLQVEGNTIVFGPAKDGFGEYLETMRQWYSEGLIDPNFTSGSMAETMDFTPIEDNDSMLFTGMSIICGDNLFSMLHAIKNENAFLQPIQNPVLNAGDEPIQVGRRIVAKDPLYITTSCKDPVLAAKWLDFQYTDEGMNLNWYGVEGESYVIGGDGTPQFTDEILSNPDAALGRYALNSGGSWLGRHNTTAALKLRGSDYEDNYQQIALDIWSEPKNLTLTDSIAFTSEEGDTVNSLMTAIITLVEEYSVNYIIGADNRTYEEFSNTLYEYGIQTCLDAYQAAYERYLAR